MRIFLHPHCKIMAECSVCFESSKNVKSLLCHESHKLCVDCMAKIAETSNNCPMCRSDSIMVERFRRKLPEMEMELDDDSTREVTIRYVFNGSKVVAQVSDNVDYLSVFQYNILCKQAMSTVYRCNVTMNKPYTKTHKNPKILRNKPKNLHC
jgi:hypothetical protein